MHPIVQGYVGPDGSKASCPKLAWELYQQHELSAINNDESNGEVATEA